MCNLWRQESVMCVYCATSFREPHIKGGSAFIQFLVNLQTTLRNGTATNKCESDCDACY